MYLGLGFPHGVGTVSFSLRGMTGIAHGSRICCFAEWTFMGGH